MRVSSNKSSISFSFSTVDLSDNISVGESYNKTPFWRIVFCSGLPSESSSLLIISFTFSTSTELGLITGIVLFVLEDLGVHSE